VTNSAGVLRSSPTELEADTDATPPLQLFRR
jgi:hypothetical protein